LGKQAELAATMVPWLSQALKVESPPAGQPAAEPETRSPSGICADPRASGPLVDVDRRVPVAERIHTFGSVGWLVEELATEITAVTGRCVRVSLISVPGW
jgi:hypothetical protein